MTDTSFISRLKFLEDQVRRILGRTPQPIRIKGSSTITATHDGNGGVTLKGSASGAPADADYLVKTANAGLSAERVVTDTSTITWDWATAGQAKANYVGPVGLTRGQALALPYAPL